MTDQRQKQLDLSKYIISAYIMRGDINPNRVADVIYALSRYVERDYCGKHNADGTEKALYFFRQGVNIDNVDPLITFEAIASLIGRGSDTLDEQNPKTIDPRDRPFAYIRIGPNTFSHFS